MTPAITWGLLVALGQVADGLTYQLAHGNGQELNPVAAGFIAVSGPAAILGLKALGAFAAGTIAWYITRGRGRVRAVVPLVALLGFGGAITNLIGSMA